MSRGNHTVHPVSDTTLSPDEKTAELTAAVEGLLHATGLDPEHKDFDGTPQRVARLWADSFLAGYHANPADILADSVLDEGQSELVVIRDLPFFGMCPHHLLPFVGKATVAYLPGDKLIGFGRVGDLVNCFTQRLTLQERACNQIVDALMQHLHTRGAGCVMVGDHSCLRIPGRRPEASVVTSSFRGEMRGRTELQDRMMP